jgi:hypothetical protein
MGDIFLTKIRNYKTEVPSVFCTSFLIGNIICGKILTAVINKYWQNATTSALNKFQKHNVEEFVIEQRILQSELMV